MAVVSDSLLFSSPMGRHAASTGNRPAPQETRTASRSAPSHRAHRAPSRRRAVENPKASQNFLSPASVPTAARAPRADPVSAPSRRRTATLERSRPQRVADVVLSQPSAPAPRAARAARAARAGRKPRAPRLATRVAALPRVLLETVAWGGFAAVVALIVIALSDVGIGRAALWAAGLGGIVVLAVAVMAVTGTHLDQLGHNDGAVSGPD